MDNKNILWSQHRSTGGKFFEETLKESDWGDGRGCCHVYTSERGDLVMVDFAWMERSTSSGMALSPDMAEALYKSLGRAIQAAKYLRLEQGGQSGMLVERLNGETPWEAIVRGTKMKLPQEDMFRSYVLYHFPDIDDIPLEVLERLHERLYNPVETEWTA